MYEVSREDSLGYPALHCPGYTTLPSLPCPELLLFFEEKREDSPGAIVQERTTIR